MYSNDLSLILPIIPLLIVMFNIGSPNTNLLDIDELFDKKYLVYPGHSIPSVELKMDANVTVILLNSHGLSMILSHGAI